MNLLAKFREKLDVLKRISPQDVLSILEDFKNLMQGETKKENFEYFDRIEGLIKVKSTHLAVIGDIHGDLASLRAIMGNINKHLPDEDSVLVFLGDYVDRGVESFETIMSIIMLKLENPEKIIMLRGNHEPPPNLIPYPHDFPLFLKMKFKKSWKEVYDVFFDIFQLLPHAAYVESKIFLVHGGVPVKTSSLEKIAFAHEEKEILEELLWNDPSDFIEEWTYSPRGAGKLFGIKITREFLRQNNFIGIIRSHEPCNGFKINHNGLVLTIFSRKGYPYFNKYASIIILNVKELKSKEDLLKHVLTF
ncbi:MAG: serine/threonine protein phosphatase [Desulfurococcales archaeon ex4484_217_1]|nr:MAG: serine/threonine protein phosphatase [Desulfurococcales archaeon ex4484_217_1]